MDLKVVLIQLMAVSTVVILVQARQVTGWRWLCLGLLVLLSLAWVQQNGLLLYLSGWLWLVLLILPLQGFAYIAHLVNQERYPQAKRWMSRLRWLHPLDGWWEYPKLLHGLELAQTGQLAPATQILQHYGGEATTLGRLARVWLHRIEGRWLEFIHWVEQANADLLQDASVRLMYLRSLGEVGALNRLLAEVERFEQQFAQRGTQSLRQLARLYAFAFCGQPDRVAWLFTQSLMQLSPPIQQFWLGTAYWRAGDPTQAQAIFKDLHQLADVGVQRAIAQRLAQPAKTEELTAPSRQILAQLVLTMAQEAQYRTSARVSYKQAPATHSLIGINTLINALFFGVAPLLLYGALLSAHQGREGVQLARVLSKGFEHLDTWYGLGAMIPARVFAGEWWRLLTGTFLHAGWFHLLANMLGLYILGGFVEPMLGRRRFLLGYLLAGIGSMALVAVLTQVGMTDEQFVVGASGAVMGVLGMMGAIFLQGWCQRREKIAAQRLRSVVMIALLQTAFDAITPQVSMMGHLSGLLLGFALGWALLPTQRKAG
jgi:rhomboid protease GluP